VERVVPAAGGGRAAGDAVEGYTQDEQGRRLLLTINEGGYIRPSALDARTLAPIPLPGFPLPGFPQGDTVYWGGTTRDGRRTVVLHESSDRPMSLGVWDWKRRRLEPWLTGAVPEFDLSRVPPATVEHYPARDGTPIPMIVRRPAGCAPAPPAAPAAPAAPADARPCPVIAIFHGGPEGQSRPRFSPIFQMWLDAGFVVVLPNVRGSTGYGREWSHADDGAGRLSVITDIEDLSRFVRKEWQVNGMAPFIGVMGSSYGGYSALMAMTRFAGAYDAGISTVGISDLESFLKNTAPYRRLLRINEYGDPALIPDAIRQLSPMHWVGQARDPLLLIQGVNDPRVPAGEALQMYEAYRARAPASLILMADQGHGASNRAGQVIQHGNQYRFFLEQHDAFSRRAARPALPQVIPQPLPTVP
jgi:dipeptidyl aminopeptidase/acylaminoacyl peptidase